MEIEEAISEDHEYHDMADPQYTIETLHEKDSHKRKLAWAGGAHTRRKKVWCSRRGV